jgi:S1-C subfamily serine protease
MLLSCPSPRGFSFANGQEPAAETPAAQTRGSFKPPLDDTLRSLDPSAGWTFVAVEPGIDRILKGDEPKDLSELRALQKQQSKVAERIQKVTVNLQHGSTQGSGVIINADGFILTAAHVAGKPRTKMTIVLHDGRKVAGESLGVNRNYDAGLVRILTSRDENGEPWPYAALPSVDEQPKVGQWCIASGHPGGWMKDRPSVIRVGRILRVADSTIVSDCPLIGGDSGGPLFDLQGKLIGIHSRIGVDVDDNMHVPMSVYNESWDRLAQGDAWGTLPGFKPVIGVTASRNSDVSTECVIGNVNASGPAAQAGMQAGDRIVRFNGAMIDSFDRLKEEVDATVPGERVLVEIVRGTERLTLRMVVGVADQQP